MLQSYFPDQKQLAIALACDSILSRIAALGAQLTKEGFSGKTRSIGGKKGAPVVKQVIQTFAPAIEACSMLGGWPGVFWARAITTETAVAGEAANLRLSATICLQVCDHGETCDCINALLSYLHYHETDANGFLIGRRAHPVMCLQCRFLPGDAWPAPTRINFGWEPLEGLMSPPSSPRVPSLTLPRCGLFFFVNILPSVLPSYICLK